MPQYLLFFCVVILFLGCSTQESEQKKVTTHLTHDISTKAFSHPVHLTNDQEDLFILGRSFFHIPWVEAPSATTARDGLGPLFSANTCVSCHPNNSAGRLYTKEKALERSLVIRLASSYQKDLRYNEGFRIEPTYGGQLSVNGTSDVAYEGNIVVEWTKHKGHFADGEDYTLHSAKYKLTNLQYGALQEGANVAPRLALPLVGLGLLEEVSEEEILKYEDINDRDGDGISGKANRVFSPEHNKTMLGRFAYKATAVDIKHQSANAAHNDMGLSNPLYPSENCTSKQKECNEALKGRHEFDLPQERLDAIALYLRSMKAPAPRENEAFKEGREIFKSLGCAKCHRESFKTQNAKIIYPYSDLLLHDMGSELADGHSDFLASANEFRTTPLWGLGLREKLTGSLNLLHDGRAHSIEEAILWHGGEASSTKNAYRHLEKTQREMLLAFLEGL